MVHRQGRDGVYYWPKSVPLQSSSSALVLSSLIRSSFLLSPSAIVISVIRLYIFSTNFEVF